MSRMEKADFDKIIEEMFSTKPKSAEQREKKKQKL
jgi:hypothetical protein